MKTVSRLIHLEVVQSVLFVAIGFLGLFVFFDFVEELKAVSRYSAQGYGLLAAAAYVGLSTPTHLYELIPIAVLIGTIFVMSRMAQRSEFTVLRTSGLSPSRALSSLIVLGVIFAIATFLMGDYLSPWADRQAGLVKSKHTAGQVLTQSGAWLKERQVDRQFVVSAAALLDDGSLRDIQLYEFQADGSIRRLIKAGKAQILEDEAWLLKSVDLLEFPDRTSGATGVSQQRLDTWRWPNAISADMVAAALLNPERMNSLSLFKYIGHLKANKQESQKFEIVFWRKVFYPLSCLVMVVLSLPFAYLHFRSGGIASHVFAGVVVGISFFLLNNLFGYVGTLQQWQPWLASALPSLIYSVISLTAFLWLVFRH